MFAIIETGGKQIKVEEGQEIFVEKLDVNEGDTFTFDKVLFVGGDSVKVERQQLKVQQLLLLLINKVAVKITVFTYKRRKIQNVKRPSSTIH